MTRRRDTGFSLLELVVVLAIFAMVALIGTQVIRATVTTDRRLSALSESGEELAVALALLRRDLGAAIGIGFITPSGAGERALRVGADGFSLSVGGLAGLPGSSAGLGRVVWRLDPGSGQLTRRVWTTLAPGSDRAASPEVVVLTDVTGIAVQSFTPETGWQPGYAADPRTPDALPHGLRVRLDHRRHNRLDTLVALR